MLKASTAHLTQPERVRVLIVDDEPSMTETLSELLGACGYDVSPTTDPDESPQGSAKAPFGASTGEGR